MALKLKYSRDLRVADKKIRAVIYGPARSGKTTFAGTFPAPIFLVPSLCEDEMEALDDQDIPYLVYSSLGEVIEACKFLENETKTGFKKTGGFATVVVENLTVAYEMWLAELEGKSHRNTQRDVWGEVHKVNLGMYRSLHALKKQHILWITHDHVKVVKENHGGKEIERSYGDFAVKGNAFKNVIAKTCMLIHTDVIRTDTREIYRAWLKKNGIWEAGGRFAADREAARALEFIGAPKHKQVHFDCLAEAMGIRTKDEEESLIFQ
jgi:hypothetical protein